MDVANFLAAVQASPEYAEQLTHLEVLPERTADYAEAKDPLPAELAGLLRQRGMHRLYRHQVEALEAARAGQDVVVVTGTASGKTLCYHLPILESLLGDPLARALYLYPTKALAQDQLKGLLTLLEQGTPSLPLKAGVYDGDTPVAQRRRIQAEAQLVLSNPDMLHASLLPYHTKWGGFFSDLRYVVLDEVHTYRGILGANVAAVLRRLQRICAHYGSRPLFLATSATIANPGELVAQLIGREVTEIRTDGSPRGRRFFGLWNPAPFGQHDLGRRSVADDAVWLMVQAMEQGAQVITFARTRQAAELIYRYARDTLERRDPRLARKLRAYRGGYLADERRGIERGLASGELRGVATTNALELGVDIGSLDVTLLAGYPGTIASAWQQAGRSGRRHEDSVTIMLAGNDPVDQYFARHPVAFFSKTPEEAVVDPRNPYVLARHLKAASFESPLESTDATYFGPLLEPLAEVLQEEQSVQRVGEQYYFTGGQNPSASISLRHVSDNTFSIVLRRPPGHASQPLRENKDAEVIANVDAISAPELLFPEAVYLHQGTTYFVRELDLDGKVAYVERHEMDYYTQAVMESQVTITATRETGEGETLAELGFGDVNVEWQTVAFKKIKFTTRENVGMGPVDIPPQNLETTAVWFAPHDAIRLQLRQQGLRLPEGMVGLRNLSLVALPILAMCDSRDLGGVVDSKNLGRTTLILYDRYPGGLGYCEKGFARFWELLAMCQAMLLECPCEEGCPSCVGLPNQRPSIHRDPDLSRGFPFPHKLATQRLLACLLDAGTTAEHSSTPPVQSVD